MKDKKATMYPSRHKIGEAVNFVVFNKNEKTIEHVIPAYIRAIIFSNCKVRYSIFLKESRTTLHNVDSVFVEDSEDEDEVDFGDDNYS